MEGRRLDYPARSQRPGSDPAPAGRWRDARPGSGREDRPAPQDEGRPAGRAQGARPKPYPGRPATGAARRPAQGPAGGFTTNEIPDTGGWWPDWSAADLCVIVAGGPSCKAIDWHAARDAAGRPGGGQTRWLAVNNAFRLIPWADALYGADGSFWRSVDGAKGFGGLKVTQDQRAAAVKAWGLRKVYAGSGASQSMAMLFGERGHIGSGKNSGFQALNLAAQFGARRIALCGFDFNLSRGTHWHGRHASPMTNPTEYAVAGWRMALDAQAGVFAERGIRVVVATKDSRLTAYPRVPLMELVGHGLPESPPLLGRPAPTNPDADQPAGN